MKVTHCDIPDVLLVEPALYGDERGFFLESWNQRAFDAVVGHDVRFVQDNHSRSSCGVLRGLHYQLPPYAQGKLVRVASGRVFDVAVDLRRGSATFCRWTAIELSAENARQVWIPAGFAHGFLVLSETSDVLYKTTAYYDAASDRGLRYDDASIGIAWPVPPAPLQLSAKDRAAPSFEQAELP